METYDLITIGGGSGGSGISNRAAMYGAKVAVIEEKAIGGTCVNVGCVPKKISWYAARIKQGIEHYGPAYGFTSQGLDFDYQTFLEARDAYIGRSRQSYTNNFSNNGVDIYQGHAKFLDAHRVEVDGKVLYGKHIAIVTGSKPYLPEVEGSDLLNDSDDFFAWESLPQSVLVVGAGYVAVELAGVLNALGVDTHLAVRYGYPLRSFDRMLSENLVQAMDKDGINLLTHTSIDRYEKNGALIDCYCQGLKVASVERVIVAAGRKANVDGLDLEKAGVVLDDRGYISVDEGHKTNIDHIYAFGDVIGKVDLTPVAIKAGRQIAEYLFNQAETSTMDYDMIPTVIFSHPAIGTIGYSEEKAVDTFGADKIKVYKSTFYSMYASAGGHREPNQFKLVCLGENEQVIGLHGIGEGVDEMIQGFAVAMKMGATKKDFDAVVAIHPTGSEEFVLMR
ncbi:TPA: glutathione-disulfide reductase [Streptococcus suis]